MNALCLPTPEQFGKVAVVMGGWSAERKVSLQSGQPIYQAFIDAGINAHAIDAERDIASVLQKADFDRAFLILHGRGGEDGHVQASLDLIGMPYTGSGVLASALAMDKYRAKAICSYFGVPTPEAYIVDSVMQATEVANTLGYPVVIKPTGEGSSLGVSMVNGSQCVRTAFETAQAYGAVMVEKRIIGQEVTAAIVGGQCLPLVSMQASGEFYDYDAKYLADDTQYQCPALLSDSLSAHIQSLALTAFNALGCAGWGRIDFMLDQSQQPYFIECNTAPGMTSHSLVPIAAQANGLDFQALCLSILAQTLQHNRGLG